MSKLVLLLAIVFVLSCSVSESKKLPSDLSIFAGTWKMENSETYEIWQQQNNILIGQVMKISNADTLTVEHLRIVKEQSNIYYEATVPSQNNGQTIRFKLTGQTPFKFQFENPEHDFPRKIVYTFKNKNELEAFISGENKKATITYQKIN